MPHDLIRLYGDTPIPTGVPGLDEMIGGGFVSYTVAALISEVGTGRTTFAMQYLYEGLKNGESCLYVSMTHTTARLKQRFVTLYPETEGYLDSRLHFYKLDTNKFDSFSYYLGNRIPELIRTLRVSRLVIDTLTMYENLLLNSPGFTDLLLYRLYVALKSEECTSLIIVSPDPSNPLHTRLGLTEKFADTTMFMFREFPDHDYLQAYRTIFLVLKSRYSVHSRVGKLVEYGELGHLSLVRPDP